MTTVSGFNTGGGSSGSNGQTSTGGTSMRTTRLLRPWVLPTTVHPPDYAYYNYLKQMEGGLELGSKLEEAYRPYLLARAWWFYANKLASYEDAATWGGQPWAWVIAQKFREEIRAHGAPPYVTAELILALSMGEEVRGAERLHQVFWMRRKVQVRYSSVLKAFENDLVCPWTLENLLLPAYIPKNDNELENIIDMGKENPKRGASYLWNIMKAERKRLPAWPLLQSLDFYLGRANAL